MTVKPFLMIDLTSDSGYLSPDISFLPVPLSFRLIIDDSSKGKKWL